MKTLEIWLSKIVCRVLDPHAFAAFDELAVAGVSFVLAVLERAEAERYRRHAARALMRGAGYAAAIAGLMAPLLALTPADVLAEGFAGSVLLAAFVLSARRAVRV